MQLVLHVSIHREATEMRRGALRGVGEGVAPEVLGRSNETGGIRVRVRGPLRRRRQVCRVFRELSKSSPPLSFFFGYKPRLSLVDET